MRRQGPITIRHLIVAVLVVVVINAQLTWWIVFVIHLNRSNLELDRQRLHEAARVEAARVEADVALARDRLAAAILSGVRPPSDPAPAQFVGWRSSPAVEGCPPAALNATGEIELSLVFDSTCVSGVVDGKWRDRLLDVGSDLEVVDVGSAGGPGVVLAPPFDGFEVRSSTQVWNESLDKYRRRIVMMVSEGVFFALLVFVLIGLLWRTFRREVELQRQHRNFLSAISHELKSPLAAMRLALETVVSGRASAEDGKRFLGNALIDTERLQGLVQKVLEATRFGEGGPQIALQRADLSEVVDAAVGSFGRTVLATGAHLDVETEARLRGEIDEEAIAIAVSNLLENAVKYGGDPPRIEVRLFLRDGNAVIEVGDNGRGIPEEDSAMIFNRFFRGGDELTRTTRGTGLGLYLVQQIVEAHRGRVEIAATGPSGTTFRISLPGFDSGG
jgi:signal transduction histidine kinase